MTVRDDEFVEETLEEEEETQDELEEQEEEQEESEQLNVQSLAAAIGEQLGDQVESVVDRRITSLMKTLRKDYGLKKVEEPERSDAPARSDSAVQKQLLKLSIREELQLQEFGSKEELKAARDLALQLSSQIRLDDDDDTDEIASDIVEQVVSTMATMRETYQKQTRSELKKRGLLREEDETDRSPGRNSEGDSHSAVKQWDRGAERAKKMFDTQQ